jgi:uncharacterized protein YqeY
MTVGRLRARLEADLLAARKAGRADEVSALRTLLAALANAEAVPVPAGPYRVVPGRADVPRRELSEAEVDGVVRDECEERRSAIAVYEARGLPTARLAAELRILERYLPASSPAPRGSPRRAARR